MGKAREFWLAAKADCQLEAFEFPCADMSNWYRAVRVIEHSAYLELKEQLARAEEVLRFYAPENGHYMTTVEMWNEPCRKWDKFDDGKRAREYFKAKG